MSSAAKRLAAIARAIALIAFSVLSAAPVRAEDAKICFTQAQFQHLSKFKIKENCLTEVTAGSFCALSNKCVGHVAQGDFDGDGKMDQAFTLALKDGDKVHWGVFATLSSFGAVIKVPSEIITDIPEPKFLRTATKDESRNPYPTGWAILLADGYDTEAFGFDRKKRSFQPVEGVEDVSARPQIGYPGLGFTLLFGTNAPFVNSGNQGPGIVNLPDTFSYQWGARIDGYISRYLDIEAGFLLFREVYKTKFNQSTTNPSTGVTTSLSGSQSYSLNSLQFPIQVKLWPSPFFSIGGGLVYTIGSGSIGCMADGNITCSAASTDYSQSGLQASYIRWIGTGGFKVRFGHSRFWLIGDLSLSGTPQLVQDATKAGGSTFSIINFNSYGGVRYALFAK